ncbi:MAG: glycosyltransferase [Solirubrobacteraceae bacterium]|nr:glycosyltransferase [Solirubrobacteraceae bacterium]
MRIGVDARHLPAGRGVARYLQHALAALAARCPGDELVAFVPGRAPVAVPDGVELRRSALPGRALHGLGAATGRPALERLCGGRLDAVWMPAPAPVGLDGSAPLVLTVHDLSFVERPGDFTAYERLWHRVGRLRRLARRAARVIAVSGATRDALVARWGLDPARVDVVHEGPGTPVAAGSDPPPGPPATAAPYLLCVGALEPRKAPELLAGAYARARARGLAAELVFAGEGRLAARLAGRPGVRVLGPVDGPRLDALYRGALAVVAPAWLEGFGLTPLEALARGVAPVVADLPVYDETLGDGAVRFPPGDAEALADALLRVAGDPALRAAVVAAGRRAIAPLTWEACADGIRAAIERAVAA